jgi:hypothetical protein
LSWLGAELFELFELLELTFPPLFESPLENNNGIKEIKRNFQFQTTNYQRSGNSKKRKDMTHNTKNYQAISFPLSLASRLITATSGLMTLHIVLNLIQ